MNIGTIQTIGALCNVKGTSTFFAVTYGGEIFKSFDDGLTWAKISTLPTPTTGGVYASKGIAFVSPSVGFCTGFTSAWAESMIFKTTDGGVTWNSVYTHSRQLLAVSFPTQTRGFVTGFGGIVLRTDDGGNSWSIYQVDPIRTLYAVSFPDENTGYVGGAGAVLWKTVDGGLTWNPVGLDFMVQQSDNTVAGYAVYGLSFITPLIGCVSGASAIAQTVDGGQSWKVIVTAPTLKVLFYGALQVDELKTLVSADYQGVVRSENLWQSYWNPPTQLTGSNSCVARNGSIIVVGGGGGNIVRSTNLGVDFGFGTGEEYQVEQAASAIEPAIATKKGKGKK